MERPTCNTRQKLAQSYRESLKSYSEEMRRLAQNEGFHGAEAHCTALYAACKKAREALRSHEAQHGCDRVASAQSSAA